ncbi:MAG TPA: putative Fe-S cluster assembly protein SufT [Acidimicrobiia bacterium]|nr:putative Fe-S cluster assembly protein SufT [Acidimicrobiia bacterium]
MSDRRAPVALTRDCMAMTVPDGNWRLLRAGAEVQIIQHLGTSITVRTGQGTLVRIAATDADALGLDRPPEPDTGAGDDQPFEMDRVLEALGGIYDPEIPISIVELGLVYRCEEVEGPGRTRRIEIDMTMTAPGCGMGDVLRSDAERAVLAVPGVGEVHVELVWDPPWTIQRMSQAARLQLGLL